MARMLVMMKAAAIQLWVLSWKHSCWRKQIMAMEESSSGFWIQSISRDDGYLIQVCIRGISQVIKYSLIDGEATLGVLKVLWKHVILHDESISLGFDKTHRLENWLLRANQKLWMIGSSLETHPQNLIVIKGTLVFSFDWSYWRKTTLDKFRHSILDKVKHWEMRTILQSTFDSQGRTPLEFVKDMTLSLIQRTL